MITKKMPDVQIPILFYLSWEQDNDIKLYRAEPVEELLKQARGKLNASNFLDNHGDIIAKIDKFLGEGKDGDTLSPTLGEKK
jgi:hypothetical protein